MKKNLIKKMVLGGVLLFSIYLPFHVTAQKPYTPLVPLPGSTTGTCTLKADGSVDPSCQAQAKNYIPAIFNLSIGLAGVLAVLMIVIGGVQYLSTDAISGKSEGRERIQNALWGLLLVIASYVILTTINPKIVKFDLDSISTLPPVASTTSPSTGLTTAGSCKANVGGQNTTIPCSCNNCVVIGRLYGQPPYNIIPLKVGQGKEIEAGVAQGMINIANELGSSVAWQVTEAWPPTVHHRDRCHTDGTCFDANLIPPIVPVGSNVPASDAQKIKAFFTAATKNFSSVTYEVPNDAAMNALYSAIYPSGAQRVFKIRVNTGATGTHFHIEK